MHGLDDGLTIARSSNIANSLYAASNFADDRGLSLQKRPKPFVLNVCVMRFCGIE